MTHGSWPQSRRTLLLFLLLGVLRPSVPFTAAQDPVPLPVQFPSEDDKASADPSANSQPPAQQEADRPTEKPAEPNLAFQPLAWEQSDRPAAVPGERKTEEKVEPKPEPKAEANRQVKCPTREEIDRRWFKPLDQVSADTRLPEGRLPVDCSDVMFREPVDCGRQLHPWACTQFEWVAPEVAFQPLYFDEVPLERYGQSAFPLLQPAISGAHFFAMFPIIPYKMGIEGPYRRVYNLGYYRPGSCAPPLRQRLPWDTRGALLEAGFATGTVFALP